jgi:hypothetical protein
MRAKMTELDAYLDRYFLTDVKFAELCELPVGKLRELVDLRLVPAPSYVVADSVVKSYVFGEMTAKHARDGRYYRAAGKVWVERALAELGGAPNGKTYERLRNAFASNMAAALADLNASTWRLADSFRESGAINETGLATRLDSMWTHHLCGTFGLCVADPESETSIARKEVVQEKITVLSENGTKSSFTIAEARSLLPLIEEYAAISMPFSPVEYARSSRKLLVDNLLVAILATVNNRP